MAQSVKGGFLRDDPGDGTLGALVISGGGGGGGGGLTNAELRASPVPVSNASLPLPTGASTEATLAAAAASLAGTLAVSGPLTDAQLRAVAVPVSGTVATGGLTDTQLRATPVPISGPLTDTQLRATPVPISGTVTASGPLTDTQLRAAPVPVSNASLPLPTGASTEATLSALNAKTAGDTTNGLRVQGRADDVTTGNITANGQTVSAAVANGAAGLTVMYYGTYATGATLVWEWSPDGGTTWAGMNALSVVANQGAPVLLIALGANATAAYSMDIPAGATNLRVRCSVWGAPTGSINIRISQSAAPHAVIPGVLAVSSITTSIVPGVAATSLGKAEDAVAASGDTGLFVLGVRNDAQATSTNADGDYIQQSHDARGAVRVNPASFTYSHIATATTTTVKSGAGDLHAITVGTKGTVASVITVYDNTAGSGTVIAIIDSLNLSGTFTFDVAFATGLTLVTTGTVAPDVTVSYR